MKTKLHLLFFAILFSVGLQAQNSVTVQSPNLTVDSFNVGEDIAITIDYVTDRTPQPNLIIEFLDGTGAQYTPRIRTFVATSGATGTETLTLKAPFVGGEIQLRIDIETIGSDPVKAYDKLVTEFITGITVVEKVITEKSTYLFDTDGDAEGWEVDHTGVRTPSSVVSGGQLTFERGTASGGYGYIYIQQNDHKLDPAIHRYVHISYRNNTENDVILTNWITSGGTRTSGFYTSVNKYADSNISIDLTSNTIGGTMGDEWTTADATGFRIAVLKNSTSTNVDGGNFIVRSIIFSSSATPPNVFTGAVNNDYANDANWSSGSAPVSTSAIVIPADKGVDVTNLTVDPAGSLTIESGGSLKVSGTASGNVTYNRTVDFVDGDLKGWFLMGAPVASQDYDDSFVTANDIAVKGSNRGISTYNTTTDNWVYHQGATSGTFAAGTGYSVKRQSSSGTVSFTGTVNVDNAGVSVPLSNTGTRFNLLGNPYTAYLSSATFLDNESSISESKTMWVYNKNLGTNGEYESKTVGQNFIIAPGQGFFVQANAVTPGSFNFSEANQSHNGTDTFQKTANVKGEITLSMTDGTINNYGKIYYVNKATKSLDIGYEGELFSGQTNDFAIYTHLVSNNVGKKYQVQSLPNSDYENMIVPVGIKAAAGKEITISATSLNLPENIKVYLEDRAMNVVTDLNNTDYKITLNSALDGVGRFFLRTSASSVLSIETITLSGISIYKTNNATLKIVGLQQGASNVKLFNILGKQILNNSFEANGVKEISLPKLATGVYIVQLETAAGKLNKKIILE